MIVTLSLNRYLHVETGTLITTFPEREMVEFKRVECLFRSDATVTIEALDELLRRQEAETASLRFGLAGQQGTMDLLNGEPRPVDVQFDLDRLKVLPRCDARLPVGLDLSDPRD